MVVFLLNIDTADHLRWHWCTNYRCFTLLLNGYFRNLV